MKIANWQVTYTAAFLFFSAGVFATAQSPQPLQPCSAAQLSFALDDENGNFNGMSHSGTLLVLRNLGPNACTVLGRPELSFEDAARHPLPISLEVPRGMHPGPVIPPVVIPVGAEVTSQLRWVSSDAFGGNNSLSPAFITLSIGGDTLRLKFTGQLFGPAGKQLTYSVTLFKRDPVYTPSSH
jgi:hypothetical protein